MENQLDNDGALLGAEAQVNAQDAMAKGSRGTMLAYLAALPRDVYEMLMKGDLKFVDHVFYGCVAIKGNTTIDFFSPQDRQILGVRNLVEMKLPKDRYFALHSVHLMTGIPAVVAVPGAPTELEIATTDWQQFSQTALKNGEFKLQIDQKLIFDEVSCELWSETSPNGIPGLYYLDNPRLVKPQVKITAQLKLSEAASLDPDQCVKFAMRGTTLVSA